MLSATFRTWNNSHDLLNSNELLRIFVRLSKIPPILSSPIPLVMGSVRQPFLLVCPKLMHFIEAAMDPVLSSSERDQIDRLTTRFEQFKQQFDRGISLQSIVTMDQLLNSISE
jgi:hypothetical protein